MEKEDEIHPPIFCSFSHLRLKLFPHQFNYDEQTKFVVSKDIQLRIIEKRSYKMHFL